jgi:hypothetical protein
MPLVAPPRGQACCPSHPAGRRTPPWIILRRGINDYARSAFNGPKHWVQRGGELPVSGVSHHPRTKVEEGG